ncbi:MAG TPA: PAS domain S-box protein [Pseudolabrys sp.]|nr:PAS domain S-box protein [Pseudolabrys sp.]
MDPAGFVKSWNLGSQHLTGFVAEEIVGQHFSRFYTLEDQAQGLPADILQTASSTGRYEGESWLVRRGGGRVWVNRLVSAIRNEAGELIGFANISRDISERRAAQSALLESERRFRLLVEGIIDYAIYMLDPAGIVTNWNAGARRLKGYTADEAVGQHFSRFYTREDRAAGVPGQMLETAAREGRCEVEGWRVRKDGSRFWALVTIDVIRGERGELIGYAKITRDITERREAQEALRESERQFRLLIGAVTDYALFMLDPNGVVTSWNAGAQRIKGYSGDDIIGQHFSRFYTDNDRAAGVPAHALQTSAREGRFEAEGWRVRKDGSLFWAHVIIDPVRDEDGTLIGFAKITRDITERMRAEAALHAAQVERAHAQKMEALGQLTGGVSHDFNNLLMIISGHMNTLNRLVAGDAKGMRAAEAVTLAARRGEALTRQLLTFSRRQTLNPVVANISERIEAVRTMLASAGTQSARLVVEIPPDIWPVKIDINELDLALINLALNARDAVAQGGAVSVSAENAQFGTDAGPNGIIGDFVVLTVADNGKGIAADVLAKVFDPFFTTKSKGKGTGLGLSQVYGFAHQSGGTVTIASELGKGTQVRLYLPRATEGAAGENVRDIEPAQGGRVLLVEDNPDVAEATASMLEQLRYTVHSVGDAQAALTALERERFDLVISDVVMPGPMDGLDLAHAIRSRLPDLPVILATGYSDAAASAAKDFTILRKPYQLGELSRAAAHVMAQASRDPQSNLIDLRSARHERKPER